MRFCSFSSDLYRLCSFLNKLIAFGPIRALLNDFDVRDAFLNHKHYFLVFLSKTCQNRSNNKKTSEQISHRQLHVLVTHCARNFLTLHVMCTHCARTVHAMFFCSGHRGDKIWSAGVILNKVVKICWELKESYHFLLFFISFCRLCVNSIKSVKLLSLFAINRIHEQNTK